MQTFTITDPREFDGNPYEVAMLAVQQASAVARILARTLSDAATMARNAEMERQLYFTGEPNPEAFTKGPQGRKFHELTEAAFAAEDALGVLLKAAGYDPKNPPKA